MGIVQHDEGLLRDTHKKSTTCKDSAITVHSDYYTLDGANFEYKRLG